MRNGKAEGEREVSRRRKKEGRRGESRMEKNGKFRKVSAYGGRQACWSVPGDSRW